MSIRLRLIVLVVCLGLAAGLGLGGLRAAALSSIDDRSTSPSQAQAFPPWKFKPVSSALPPGIQLGYVHDVGEQGELVVTYYTQTVGSAANYGVAFGGTLTHMFSPGDEAPGGVTFTDMWKVYAASPSLVYFSAFVHEGGPGFLRHFRWSNGVLTHLPTQSNESYDVTMHDAHGKFIFKRTVDAENTEYRITDGVTFSDPIILHTDLVDDDPNTSQQLLGITADGAFLIGESTSSGSTTCTLRPTAPDQPNEVTATSRLFWLGSRSGDVVAGSYTSNVCGGSGTTVGYGVMNSAGDILSQEHSQVIQPGGTGVTMLTTLRLYPGNGAVSSVVAQGEHVGNVGPYFFLRPVAITEWSQPIFQASTDLQNNTTGLFSGLNPAADRFDGDFVQGFGQDGTLNGIYHISEKGRLAGQAQLADTTLVDVIGSASSASQWIDPAGGSWGDAGNWDSNEVPGSTSETLFNLEATYPVTIGTRTSGRSRIENGNVSFRNADLTLIGPLSIGGDAKLTLPEGTLKVSEITLGHLPPISPLTPTLAQLYVSNVGTVITGSTAINIGAASEGELFISDASLNSSQVRIGVNSPGMAVIGGQHAFWGTDSVAVGYGYTGTLTIERGGEMRSFGEVVIGNGTTLQDYTATVDVSNQGLPMLGLGNWLINGLFTLGNNLRGELYISKGGSVYITEGLLQAGLQAHGTSFDAFMDVDGSGDTVGVTSTLGTFGDVLLGMAAGADVGVNISRGGEMFIAGANLYLGYEAGSEATLTVAGINNHGARAHLEVPGESGSFGTGICSVGENGQASLLVREGGMVECKTIRIGALPGSNGYVLVDGQNGSSTLYSQGSLCIGSDSLGLCNGAASGQQGTLELRNSGNAVSERATVIGTGGRLTGSGILIPGVLGLGVFDGGVIEPGVTVLGAQRALAVLQAIQPGALNIGGNVSISPTAVITLDVIGKTPSLYDRLIISGTAKLGGQLVLNFGDGFAPKQGESYNVMQAGAFASAFQTATIAGLAPGFTYILSATGAAFHLVPWNDGVPTTQPTARKVYLPLIRR